MTYDLKRIRELLNQIFTEQGHIGSLIPHNDLKEIQASLWQNEKEINA